MSVLADLQSLIDDPLGEVIVQTWRIPGGELRWNSGTVQTRRDGDESFSFPILAAEYLAAVAAGEQA